MGFFKNVGKTLKKNISFKNLVKVATKASGFIPGVGGVVQEQMQALTQANEAKKEAKRAQQQGNIELAQQKQAEADLLTASVGKTVGSMSKSISAQIATATLDEAKQGITDGTMKTAGNLGADLVNSTIKEWFNRNWKIVLGSIVGLFLLWKFILKPHPSAPRRRLNKTRFM